MNRALRGGSRKNKIVFYAYLAGDILPHVVMTISLALRFIFHFYLSMSIYVHRYRSFD
jgi:hypothetical protein